jgi:hypothetical protein
MVRFASGGSIPAIRLQGHSLDMMAGGAPARKLAQSIDAGGRNWARPMEKAASATMRPFPMSRVQMKAVAGGVPINGTRWQDRDRRSNPRQAGPGSANYNQDTFLLEPS